LLIDRKENKTLDLFKLLDCCCGQVGIPRGNITMLFETKCFRRRYRKTLLLSFSEIEDFSFSKAFRESAANRRASYVCN
jgi:hypothetical protein